MTTRGVSKSGDPIVVTEPWLTRRRAAIIISLMLFLGFFFIPLWENVVVEMY